MVLLEQIAQEDNNMGRLIAGLLPSISEVANVLIPLRKALTIFNSVSLKLQKKDGCISMLDACVDR